MPGHADLSDLDRLLSAYQFVFEKARYYYELYTGYTLEQQRELGEFWEQLGAPENEADVRYYPMELDCLVHALRTFIETRLRGTDMPIEVTLEQVADTLLDILVKDLGLQPGQDIPDQTLKERFRARSYDAANIKDGLEYAHQRGWVQYDAARDRFTLTADGFEYAT
jgi:hypothetical protein